MSQVAPLNDVTFDRSLDALVTSEELRVTHQATPDRATRRATTRSISRT
jgi:propanediol dehydratase small subunit